MYEKADDKFITTDLIQDIFKNAINNNLVFDWNFGTDFSVKEKFDFLWVALNSLANRTIQQGANGYFWIVTSANIASIFELCCSPSINYTSYQIPMGKLSDVQYHGIIGQKFRMYIDHSLFDSKIVMGAGFSKKPYDQYGVLYISNMF